MKTNPDTVKSIVTRYIPLCSAMAVAVVCLLVYARALSCDFVNFDDPYYVIDNHIIRNFNLEMLISVFTQIHVGWWMPLTWVSFAADYHFWGLDPKGYHLTNILLHAANSAIVVFITARFSPPEAFAKEKPDYFKACIPLLAGLIFSIHPLRVESVAWVTERKDVLNGFFTLGSVYFYLAYVGAKAADKAGNRTKCLYLLSLALLAMSLMAKSISVVLPAILLLLDWYPLQRFKKGHYARIITEKIPFFFISAAMIIVTIITSLGTEGFYIPADSLSFPLRIMVAGNAVIEYCRLLLFPVEILPFYLLDKDIPYSFAINTALSIAITVSAMLLARKKPIFLTVWLLFIIPMLPVMGFLQSGDQAYAARFTYLPSVGPSIAFATLFAFACKRAAQYGKGLNYALILLLSCTITYYAWMSQRLIADWQDTGTFWSRVIDSQPMGRAYRERGFFYQSTGRYADAINDFSLAIDIAAALQRNDIFNLHAYRGEAFRKSGRYKEAISDFRIAISLHPHPRYYYRLGLALKETGNISEAATYFQLANGETGPIEWITP